MTSASSEDLAELRSGSASARDKAEAAKGDPKGATRKAIKRGKGGSTKKRRARKN
jgi:hypothetical protein